MSGYFARDCIYRSTYVRLEIAKLKDFVDEKFEEQKEFIDGKFEEQEQFIQDQFDQQAQFIEEQIADVEEKIAEATDENNLVQIALYEAQKTNLLSMQQDIEDEFERLSADITSTIEDLEDFYTNIKVIDNSVDAESSLQELEEKFTFLQGAIYIFRHHRHMFSRQIGHLVAKFTKYQF